MQKLLGFLVVLLLLGGCSANNGVNLSNDTSATNHVTGEVYDAATTNELALAKVTLNGTVATTNDGGAFDFQGISPGTYPLNVTMAGYEDYQTNVTIGAGDVELPAVSLFPPGYAGTVKGHVADGQTSQSLVGAVVTIDETTSVTDSSGNYSIAHVPPTLHDVTVTQANYNSGSAVFTVVPDGAVTVDFTLYSSGSTGSLKGTVKESGTITLISGVTVAGPGGNTTSQTDGSYNLTNVPAGTQKITATKPYYDSVDATAVVAPNVTTTQNFGLTLSTRMMRKQPYLLMSPDNRQMGVRWQTFHTPKTSSIEWGDTTEYKGGSATVQENSSSANEHLFSHTITGLTAAKKTYYRVHVDAAAFEGSFVTAPDKAATKVVFYGYGDTRTQPAEHNAVLKAVMADMDSDTSTDRHTFLIHGGDFVSRGLTENYWDEEYFNPGSSDVQKFLARVPIMATLGNHECYKAAPGNGALFESKHGGELYRKYWPYPGYPKPDRFYHSFDYGPVHIAAVDAYMYPTLAPGGEEHEWLDQDLANSDRKWKIVVLHPPLYASTVYDKKLDTDLYDILQKRGVKLVMQSHVHYFSRVDVTSEGIQYLTLGGGGAPVMPCKPYNSTSAQYPIVAAEDYNFGRFEADEQSLKVTVFNAKGGKLDEFVIR